MKLTKPSTGEKVTVKEFFKQWKEGMNKVTPLQQTYSQIFGQIISFIGVVWGIIFSIRLSYWWMMTILIGGVIVLMTQLLGTWQKLMILKMMDKVMKESESLDNSQLNMKQEVK